MVRVATRGSTRQKFFLALSRIPEREVINFNSMAMGMEVSAGLLSRYLREARQFRWVEAEAVWGGMRITILDHAGLERAAGLEVP